MMDDTIHTRNHMLARIAKIIGFDPKVTAPTTDIGYTRAVWEDVSAPYGSTTIHVTFDKRDNIVDMRSYRRYERKYSSRLGVRYNGGSDSYEDVSIFLALEGIKIA